MKGCKDCKKLREENRNLEKFFDFASPSEWDLQSLYEDIYSGRDQYTGEVSKPDKKFAKWFANRFGIQELDE